MIKIAFCDDDLSVLRELSALMDKYRVERNQNIMYASFNSPLELLTEVERGTRLDIIFLDVLMPAQNGISTAMEIRQYDTSVKIIYLTSSAEYAVDSYSVGAYFYQLKPIWQESFYRLMDSVLSECHKDKENSLILRFFLALWLAVKQAGSNSVLGRALELSSMGIRVDPAALDRQLSLAGCDDRRTLPFHKSLLAGELPLTVGGGIGQSRLCMQLLGKAHIGEVQASVWDEETIRVCQEAGVILL